MKELKPQLAPKFTPGWDFMNDPKLCELQLCLDACYLGAEPETQSARDLARNKFTNLPYLFVYTLFSIVPHFSNRFIS